MELLIQKEIKMTTTNEKLRNVAEIAAKIMMGEKALHPNQQKLDVHEPEKDKLTAKDFEMLRAGKKKVKENLEDFSLEEIEAFMMSEDFEQLDELSKQTLKSYRVKSIGRDARIEKKGYEAANKDGGAGSDRADQLFNKADLVTAARKRAQEKMRKEDVELTQEEVDQIEEMEIVKTATGMRVYGSSYGDSAKARRDQVKKSIDTAKGPKMKELSDIEAEKKKKKKMSEMVALYQEQGLKGLFASLVKEEPDNEQFTKELEAQKAKNAGQGKKAEVAKAAVQAVQEEEFEIVMDELNGYAEATIEERSMTEPEIKKKEQIVKSMKKGISGFKARYGDDAKSVMYATATKRAMGEEVEQIDEAVTHGDYTITHKPYNGTDKQRHVSNDITHAYSTNQKKLGIKYSKDEDEIGPDRHITVKNNKTGEVSHHVATHNNTYKDEHEKQKISIRAHGEITPHDDKHAKVIKSFLAPTKASS